MINPFLIKPEQSTSSNDQFFKLEIKLKVLKNDIVQIFYKIKPTTVDGAPKFSEFQSLSKQILPSNNYQIVKFKLPIKALNENIRIDLGRVPENNWKIKLITVKALNKVAYFEPTEILQYFIANSYLKRNLNNNTDIEYKTVKIKSKCDPFLTSSISFESYFLKKRDKSIRFFFFFIAILFLIIFNRNTLKLNYII